jgi:hypothetical protein
MRGVEFLADDQRAVAFHLDREQAGNAGLGLGAVAPAIRT